MNESLNNLATIRQYLLGRISDENTLEGIEELLFADDEFCTKTEIVEDELINDFVFGKLNSDDNLSFEKTLENNPNRRAKVKVTQLLKEKIQTVATEEKVTFFDSIKAFLRQPIYAGGFALLLIAILIGAILLSRSSNNSELAELKSIYKDNRPFETRLSEFDYAPYQVTRGEENLPDAEKRKLRLVETKLLEAVDKNSNAENHHALGVFYLTQAKYADSIKELEQAVKLNDKNAEFHNSLGSAYFEFGKLEKENKLLNIAKANESFSKSLELNPNFLEALFNRSLALQELNLPRQAKESWELYLQKDSASKWADEARKNLEKIAQMQSSFKTKEQVLEDFLTAYRQGDQEFAWKINCQTKEMISGVWLPDQLSRRYLFARKNKDDPTAKESIEALTYIGKLEHDRNADFFVRDLAEYYANVGDGKIEGLLKAKELLSEGYAFAPQSKFQLAQIKFEEAKSLFIANNNNVEQKIAEYWIAFCLADMAKLSESQIKTENLESACQKQGYKWLQMVALTRLGDIVFRQNKMTMSLNYSRKSLKLSEQISDSLYQQRILSDIVFFYFQIGDFENTILTQSKILDINKDYYQSRFQNLRNIGRYFEAIQKLDLTQNNIDFAKEYDQIASEKIENKALIFDSKIILTKVYLQDNELDKAMVSVNQSILVANEIQDDKSQKLSLAYSNLFKGKIFLIQNLPDQGLNSFNLAIANYENNNEFAVNNYLAHLGKLFCFEKLNLSNDFETEFEIVSQLFENYRSQILEEESRNYFFDRENKFANISANYFLKKNNPENAFNSLENSRARSLLDLLQTKAKYNEKVEQIIFNESSKPYGLDEIQSRLSADVQLIQYTIFEDKIIIWLISNNQFEVATTLISEAALEQKVKGYLDLIKSKSSNTQNISKELYDILLKPILAKVDKNKQICFLPDGILYHLPFTALVSSDTDKYLIEDFAVFYSLSATISIILNEKSKFKEKKENLLVIGNPLYNIAINSRLQYLPSAEKEVEEISKFYPESKKLIKSEATKAKVLADISKVNIFHFAGHYVTNPNSTFNSKLLLAQPIDSIDEFEGELRASEILQLKNTKLKLVILSACDSGIERFYKGEGAIGMARNFLAIGTPLVIASQWKVESESTAELMRIFHRNRQMNGFKTIESLRQAQIEIIAKKEFSQPYFWAAFSVIGGNVNY